MTVAVDPSYVKRFRAISLKFDENDICVGCTRVLADVRLGRVPDDFVRRFFDVYSAVSDSQPPPEMAESDENAIGMLVRLSSITRPIYVSQHAHAVVLEENFVQLRIAYCRILFHASLLRFTRKKVNLRSTRRRGNFNDLQKFSPTARGTQPGSGGVRANAARDTQPNALATDV